MQVPDSVSSNSASNNVTTVVTTTVTTTVTSAGKNAAKIHFLFLNLGHFLDHFFMLIFSTVAAVVLVHEWNLSYSQLIPYATPGFVAFAAFTIPAGWLADRYGRERLMVVFFIGCGLAAMLCALATTPLRMSLSLFLVGVFAAIYHPVGIALVLEGGRTVGLRIASNGVWGNLGVAVGALLTGALIDAAGWRAAFVIPGLFSVLLGIVYAVRVQHYSPSRLVALSHDDEKLTDNVSEKSPEQTSPDDITANKSVSPAQVLSVENKSRLLRVFAVVLLTTACGGVVFQSTTFSLPKVLLERSADLASSATALGWLAFIVFAIASCGQLVVGYLIDRPGSARRIFSGVALMQLVFFLLALGAKGVWAPIVAVGFMLAAFGQIPINDVLVGRATPAAYRSRVLAIRYTVTLSTMALSVPLIALLYAGGGVVHLFLLLAAMATIILICTRFLPADL